MPMRTPINIYEINTATRATIAVLSSLKLDCVLVGSVACYAYGMPRTPNDIDMLVLTSSYTQEGLKALVVQRDSRFYRIASKDPSATYTVLWFRLAGYNRCCKVDLLLPGIMNIPSVSSSRIYRIKDHPSWEDVMRSGYSSLTRDYPLMPFLPLLLLKLQAWQDHAESSKIYMRNKVPTDITDIQELLRLAEAQLSTSEGARDLVGMTGTGKRTLLETEVSHLSESFVRDARTRVRKFAERNGGSATQWRMLGFEVNNSSSHGAHSHKNIPHKNIMDLLRMMDSLDLEY